MSDAFDEALALANEAPRDTSTPGGSAPSVSAPGRTPAARKKPDAAHRHLGWDAARRVAHRTAGRPLAPVGRPLDERALGHTLAEPLEALTDLPAFDASAMDGWAVSGPGPWHLAPGTGVLAGHAAPSPLTDGDAVPVATGARVPAGATAVLRSERGTVTGGQLRGPNPQPGADIRTRGQECRSGTALLPAGTPITPVVLGLAAAAGYDELTVRPRPRVDILVLGDELLVSGRPQEGRIRDAIGPMAGPWLTALGADVIATRHLGDDAEALHRALVTSRADLIITTGGTAAGPVDHVHPTLRRLGARLTVNGVAVRPGHPMLLAELPDGPPLIGLPGNPLAAVSGLLTLAAPLLRALTGRSAPEEPQATLTGPVRRHPADTRLVPVTCPAPGRAEPLRYAGPAMLRGIAAATALAVVPPGPEPSGEALSAGHVRLLELPRS
ncbi:molybdopterin molybdotransferase MoeA [Streptomyces sp. ACA25]|uniref:molybdopterin molybdotransferase MoeA n=1 Tax=Streptomyces sp. ACA25 TaxID=3022596 RepID=UPI002307616E|nr:molybdopterin molybdotransferase MoeA [Streptomyces sp. ACA25]MDB1086333.1 molybdopterin molybdotransferase MoeA [Streptomyces sp. ACA25]